MTDVSGSANAVVRAAFLKISAETVLATADALDLRAHSKVSAVVGVPFDSFSSVVTSGCSPRQHRLLP